MRKEAIVSFSLVPCTIPDLVQQWLHVSIAVRNSITKSNFGRKGFVS